MFGLCHSSQTLHSISVTLSVLADGSQFTCMAVYAPTEHSEKQGFLEEISLLAPADSHPWIIFDDFNLVRFPDDKNNEAFHATEAAWFNSTIPDLALLEIPLLGRQFTWSNRRDNPTLVRLDRVVVNDA